MTEACTCMECRIRAAIGANPTTPISLREPLIAMGEIMGEMLAHLPDASAREFLAQVDACRKRYVAEPRVAVQRPPMGNA